MADPDLALACDRVLGLNSLDDCAEQERIGIIETSRSVVARALNARRYHELHVQVEWTPLDAAAVTDGHLRVLFAAHCECRPLDLRRGEGDHSHDCDTSVLAEVQGALAASGGANGAQLQRCAQIFNGDMVSGIYRPRVIVALMGDE